MLLHAVARSTTLQIISRDFVAPPQGPQWPDLALLRTLGSFENLEGEASCNPRDLLLFLPKSGIAQVIVRTLFFLILDPQDLSRATSQKVPLSTIYGTILKIICQPSQIEALSLFRMN